MIRPPVPHYQQGDIELLDALRVVLGKRGYEDYLTGQVFKYLWRFRAKGTPLGDARKASHYLGWLIESLDTLDLKE